MKLQIFIRTFWAPILLLIFLFFRLESGYTTFKTFGAIVFFASILFSRLLSDIRYIQNLSITEDKIIIHYVNQFLIAKSLELPVKSITGLRMTKKSRIPLWLPTIEFKLDNERHAFNILPEDLFHKIQQELNAANLNPFHNNLATS